MRTLLLYITYFLIGFGCFTSITIRTQRNCPEEGIGRAMVYGVGWPILLGYKILDGDMKNIPNCKMDPKLLEDVGPTIPNDIFKND